MLHFSKDMKINSNPQILHIYIMDTFNNSPHEVQVVRDNLMSIIKALVFGRYQNSAPQSITEKPMEYYHLEFWMKDLK